MKLTDIFKQPKDEKKLKALKLEFVLDEIDFDLDPDPDDKAAAAAMKDIEKDTKKSEEKRRDSNKYWHSPYWPDDFDKDDPEYTRIETQVDEQGFDPSGPTGETQQFQVNKEIIRSMKAKNDAHPFARNEFGKLTKQSAEDVDEDYVKLPEKRKGVFNVSAKDVLSMSPEEWEAYEKKQDAAIKRAETAKINKLKARALGKSEKKKGRRKKEDIPLKSDDIESAAKKLQKHFGEDIDNEDDDWLQKIVRKSKRSPLQKHREEEEGMKKTVDTLDKGIKQMQSLQGEDIDEVSTQQAMKMFGVKGLKRGVAGTQKLGRGVSGGTQKQQAARKAKLAKVTGQAVGTTGGKKVFAGTQKRKRAEQAAKQLQKKLGSRAAKALY